MDGVGAAVADTVADFLVASTPIIASGLGVVAVIWGAPKLIGLFKRIAK
jgi:hypothetical protein